MSEPIDILEDRLLRDEPGLLEVLLVDHSTQKNIFWATDSYVAEGDGYGWHDSITVSAITGKHGSIIMPRALKTRDEQLRRSRQMAEVFTPAWLVKKMNDAIDDEWNRAQDGLEAEMEPWQRYVLTTELEISCGEAPFLTSRYDTVTAEPIPIDERVGLLDRKLKRVNEEASDEEWTRWALLALAHVYGYEWQGDNLLLAREALLATFVDYHEQRFSCRPAQDIIRKAAEIIAWNVWQMDGLKAVVPASCHDEKTVEAGLFETIETITPCAGCQKDDVLQHNGQQCRLRRWLPSATETPDSFECNYTDFITKKHKTYHKRKWLMRFDFVVGNPPYQQESNGANESDTPLYHYFFDGACQVSNSVELITPARFLFNAGGTPKEWNAKMLNSEHIKVLEYVPISAKVFPNTDIKGGVAITYYDACQTFEPIVMFVQFDEMYAIFKKVNKASKGSLSSIITNRGIYRYSEKAYQEHPQVLARTADARIAPSSFERMPELFKDAKPEGSEYVKIYGISNVGRLFKWFKKDYIKPIENLNQYKVVVPKANGNGTFGEVLSNPLVLGPGEGFTETFISMYSSNEEEANAILKYVKSKFARAMLSILKVTQNNAKPTWKYVPLQDFSMSSDIDWSQSISSINLQLYDKYGLSEEERNFIETHVKEMD